MVKLRLQPPKLAALIFSFVIPPLVAAEADAPQVKCAPKIDDSIADCSYVSCNHLKLYLMDFIVSFNKEHMSDDSASRSGLVLLFPDAITLLEYR